jgi:hypothetical protein
MYMQLEKAPAEVLRATAACGKAVREQRSGCGMNLQLVQAGSFWILLPRHAERIADHAQEAIG